MEVFNKDIMAHPKQAHVFVVPRLMPHLWRKHLGKDSDVLITITTGDHFWDKSQHEPLIFIIVSSLAYVKKYRGPWFARRLEEPESLQKELKAGFKIAGARKPKEFTHMDGKLRRMWEDPEGRSMTLLFHFLD